MIRLSISLKSSFWLRSFNLTALVTVSFSPPLLLTITAQPLEDASKLVLPKGSSHLEQVTAILDFSYNFKILSWLIKPCLINRSWLKSSFSSISTPPLCGRGIKGAGA